MTNVMTMDTLKFSRKLTEAGLDAKVAEAIVEGLADADTSSIATKQDLSEFKADLFRHLWVMAVGIVGLTVTLIKILP